MDNSWSVYKHTFPNGKIYIGITSGNPVDRWANGFGYKNQKKMFNEIILYGWYNIQHEIIKDNISENKAREMEKRLIIEAIKNKEKVLNTAYANDYEFTNKIKKRKTWVDEIITESSIKKCYAKFMMLDDYWLDIYYNLTGKRFISVSMSEKSITLYNIEIIDDNYIRNDYCIIYPEYIKTFLDLYELLCSGYLGDWVKGQQEAILKENEFKAD